MNDYGGLSAAEQLAYRKKREIWKKLGALSCEFDSWLKRSAEAGDFEKHHSQIRAIKAHLGQWHAAVRRLVRKNLRADAETFLQSIFNAEKLTLSEHRIWEYFRSKLIQREEADFRRYLAAADEFAWACYSPVQRHVYPDPTSASRKEPPLVFFNGGMSPFSASRGKEFKPEPTQDPAEELGGKEIEALRKLPIPVIGVPWHQIRHLPEAVVIGHEVGHLVEDDFGLTERLKSLLKEALAESGGGERAGAWSSWLGEIFADIYGCLSAGPAFAGALIDYLAKDYGEISVERKTEKNWGLYPTIYLRGRILLESLRRLDFGEEAARYQKLWDGLSSRMPKGFDDDVPHIVSKLLNGKVLLSTAPGTAPSSVREVFTFSLDEWESVEQTLEELRMRMKPTSKDIRVLFASARAAYEADPKKFNREDYAERILARIETGVIKQGTRRGEEPLSEDEVAKKLEAYERSALKTIDDILNATGT